MDAKQLSTRLTALNALKELTDGWPIGQRVRHRDSGWRGTITTGDTATCPGVHVGSDPAHCLVPAEAGRVPGAVCVQWDHPASQPGAGDRDPFISPWPHPRIGTAWMRPGVLWPLRREVTRS